MESLSEREWLPAEGDEANWHVSGELYVTRHRDLFRTSGRFIALSPAQQTALKPALDALDVKETPTVDDVVAHVINLARAGEAPSAKVLGWLDSHAHEADIQKLRTVAFLP